MIRSALVIGAFVLLLLLSVVTVRASETYANGHFNSDGYIWQDGYWYWSDGSAWTRRWQTYYQSYTHCGYCYSRPVGYWHYYRASPPRVSAADPDWRSKLLDLAMQRDKYVLKGRYQQYEQANFAESVKLLGLEGNFRVESYGAAPPYSYSSGYAAGAYTGGNTLYGHSFQSIADLYGDNSVALGFQAMNRATQNAQQLAGQVATDLATVIEKEGAGRAKVAEVLARGQAVAQAFKSLEQNAGKIEHREFHFKVVPGQDGKLDVEKVDPKAGGIVDPKTFAHMVRQDCGSCHSGAGKKGGFEISQLAGMSKQEKASVAERLVTHDLAKRMPRTADGGPGQLPQERLVQYLTYLAN